MVFQLVIDGLTILILVSVAFAFISSRKTAEINPSKETSTKCPARTSEYHALTIVECVCIESLSNQPMLGFSNDEYVRSW